MLLGEKYASKTLQHPFYSLKQCDATSTFENLNSLFIWEWDFLNVANFLIPRNPALGADGEISKIVNVIFEVEQCRGITQRSPEGHSTSPRCPIESITDCRKTMKIQWNSWSFFIPKWWRLPTLEQEFINFPMSNDKKYKNHNNKKHKKR